MNRSILDTTAAGSATPHDAGASVEPDEQQPADRPVEVTPDSEIGEEDPGAGVDQPAVEPIYPPGSHGH